METPDRWVILKIEGNKEPISEYFTGIDRITVQHDKNLDDMQLYKVFAVFNGGYLNGDSWKLNSGVQSVEENENYYYFKGYSGSIYKCYKKSYGINTTYGSQVLYELLNNSKGLALQKDRDWKTFFDKNLINHSGVILDESKMEETGNLVEFFPKKK